MASKKSEGDPALKKKLENLTSLYNEAKAQVAEKTKELERLLQEITDIESKAPSLASLEDARLQYARSCPLTAVERKVLKNACTSEVTDGSTARQLLKKGYLRVAPANTTRHLHLTITDAGKAKLAKK
jgi:DNA repair exonuclease SbcCD ATPase subunit